MIDNRENRNLGISNVLGSLMLEQRALKLIGSILVSAVLVALYQGETHAQDEEGCCQFVNPPGCFNGSGDLDQFLCEVTDGEGATWNPGQRCNFRTNMCESPTAIELISFTAETVDNGTVTLVWETATEIDNAGFNLYRANAKGGPYTQINSALIPAQGDPVAGASYSFKDSPGPGTFRYILTDVDTSGKVALHGPVKVKVAVE